MEMLTSREATTRLRLQNVQAFLRAAARNGVAPVLEAPGLRGAKFWNPRDVERLATILGIDGEVA